MNILLLNYEYPPLGGGAGLISRYIAEGLAELGNTVTVLTTWYAGEEEHSMHMEGKLQIIRLKSARKLTFRSNLKEMISWIRHSNNYLPAHLMNHSYDVVFANFALPGGEVARKIFKQHHIPYVIISHGHDIPWLFPGQMWFYHLLTYLRIQKICSHCSVLFVQSGDMLRNAQRFVGKKHSDKVRLVPNGADFKMFFPDNTPRPERFRILFAGRLVKQKGPMLFLKAIRKLHEMGIPFEVIVIGDGPMRHAMHHYVETHKLRAMVRFIGWLSKEEMPSAYRSAHCMVAPSLNEGMSMAMNEALASGLYVFATDVSCNAALLRPEINGELIPGKDAETLAQQLAVFYRTRFLQDYRVPLDEVTHFHEAYNWYSIAHQYEEILKEVMGLGGENAISSE